MCLFYHLDLYLNRWFRRWTTNGYIGDDLAAAAADDDGDDDESHLQGKSMCPLTLYAPLGMVYDSIIERERASARNMGILSVKFPLPFPPSPSCLVSPISY